MTHGMYRMARRYMLLLLAWPMLGRAQGASPARGQVAGAKAEMGMDWLEVRFPPLDLSTAGCPYVSDLSGGRRGRVYHWQVTAQFPDRGPTVNHFMAVYVIFTVPDTGVLTPARLDSALAAARLTVNEARGEPPHTAAYVVPLRASARRKDYGLRLRIEGRAAVQAFARALTDSVDVTWCQRDNFMAGTRVALRRR